MSGDRSREKRPGGFLGSQRVTNSLCLGPEGECLYRYSLVDSKTYAVRCRCPRHLSVHADFASDSPSIVQINQGSKMLLSLRCRTCAQRLPYTYCPFATGFSRITMFCPIVPVAHDSIAEASYHGAMSGYGQDFLMFR